MTDLSTLLVATKAIAIAALTIPVVVGLIRVWIHRG
jgi:hypothetical protein